VDQRLILITLLVKLGVAAAVASAVVRSRYFKSLLFREERTLAQKVHLALYLVVPVGLGVMVRLAVKNFLAADLGYECAILLGVIGGRVTGGLGGALLAIPAMIHGEFATLPMNVGAGLAAGWLRTLARDHEDIWTFSPFIDLSIYRWLKRNVQRRRMEWQTAFFALILTLQYLHILVGEGFPGRLFYVGFPPWTHNTVTDALVFGAFWAAAVAVVAIPLKIWNNTRIELKLEEQERLLLQARMEALQTQINPHFLFNTLNSIASLVRFDPDAARELVVKLASILRRLLRQHEAFIQLREEVEFIDDYLDIEVVRFGRDKLRVTKELDPATLDLLVPSMVLQPLVENAIKHGLAPRLDGGSITLRSRLAEGKLVIQVEDDGVGMAEAGAQPAADSVSTGIGMANVAERLHVLYGDAAKMSSGSREGDGEGTRITLELPLVETEAGAKSESAAAVLYEARSSTQR
jgi:two-component system LytT family sensor kinase